MPSSKGKPTDPKLREEIKEEIKQEPNKSGGGEGQWAAWKASHSIGKQRFEQSFVELRFDGRWFAIADGHPGIKAGKRGGGYENEPGSKNEPKTGEPQKKSESKKKAETEE
ncbi:ankyrin repeat protein [Colletotrichum tofieldiae]|nr:ankyrin repeat protein [Colletotrichum tofieldiae]